MNINKYPLLYPASKKTIRFRSHPEREQFLIADEDNNTTSGGKSASESISTRGTDQMNQTSNFSVPVVYMLPRPVAKANPVLSWAI